MNIYTAAQIRAWDAYTIEHEPIASIELMERAAKACVQWIRSRYIQKTSFKIFCGKGNNGGDGLAIARLLFLEGHSIEVYILEFGKLGSNDFQLNLQQLHELPITIHFVQYETNIPSFNKEDVIIDALYGTGLNKPLDGLSAELVKLINSCESNTISIDLPSGLYADQSSKGNVVIKASHTLSFQCYKMAFLVAENEAFIGEVHLLEIGLHPDFLLETKSSQQLIDRLLITSVFKTRKQFAHKGNFGHALIVGGSFGKLGAIVLSTMAALRSGAGLVTTYVPGCGYTILQITAPEAMAITDKEFNELSELPPDIDKYTSIGIGPGMGTSKQTQDMFFNLLKKYNHPLIIDADGLNCLGPQKETWKHLPKGSVLTPHPKEFERMFGACANDFERISLAQKKAIELQVVIVLKGHHTVIAQPDGALFFNTTGNAGMAKGGSGDVLTGIITALCCQQYKPEEAAILGVYLHGLAGDLAAAALSQEAMTAKDIITFLSQGFQQLNDWKKV